MNLLEIAELRDRLKEDIAVIERFMDIVRREQGTRPLYDRPLPPTIEEQLREAGRAPENVTYTKAEAVCLRCGVSLAGSVFAPVDNGKLCMECYSQPAKPAPCKSC